jgi:hypothetical protein
MKAEFENYLAKHKTEPFVMLDEMDLDFEQFSELFKRDYAFQQMWKLECEFNYYEIRAGKCQNAKVIHGKIICSVKGCN